MHHTLFARWILVATILMGVAIPTSAALTTAPIPTPQFRSYGLHEGLPSSKVQAVVQDARGFIWVATAAGLSRFDGVEFTVPRIGPRREHAMPTGGLSVLFVDRDDRIWMGGAETGLGRYDPDTGVFVQWRDGLTSDDVRAIAQTPDGAIWVGSAKGLDRMRADGSAPERVGDLRRGAVNALHVADDGRLWIGADTGLFVADSDGRVSPRAFTDGSPVRVQGIGGGPAELRIATDRGLFRLTADARPVRERRVAAGRVFGTLADSHGILWIASAQGLSMLDRFDRMHDVAGSWTAAGGLPGRTVRGMLEDREHGLWFALSDGGLAYLGPSWDDFTRFSHVATDPHTFPGRTVTAVAAREGGGLWVGGLRGWIRGFDPATGHTSPGFELGAPRIQSLLALPGQRLLIGTVDGLTVGRGRTAQPVLRSTIDRPVTTMASGPGGDVFVAALDAGLFRVDADLGHAARVRFAETPRGWADTRQIEMVDGDLWQASLAGLARQDRATGEMRFIEGVARGRINAFEPDGDGFWVVRPDALERFHWQGASAVRDRHIGGAEGFPSTEILNLRRDRGGRLWLYGQTGVWRFDPEHGRFRSFGMADGLASGEFTHATTVLLDDGSMYGGTLAGLVGFRPDAQRDHVRRPTITVLGATVSRHGRREVLPIENGTLNLAWDDREPRLSARVLSFVHPDRNHVRFEVRRDDDASPVRVASDGERVFEGLPAGRYAMSITGAGRDELSPALPAAFVVVMEAPPWQRWWAWVGYALLATAAVVAVLRGTRRRVRQAMRMRLAEHQRRMAEEASAAKTEFMATLGHEIRTPMTGVLGMAELLARTPLDDAQRGYVDAVRRSGDTLLRLVNDALDIARIESRRLVLESDCVSMRSVADEVVALAATRAREKGLALTVSVDAAVPATLRGDAVRLRQVLQNLVNNAVKFTEAGGVSVALSACAGSLIMTVSDTGPGMSAELRARLYSRFEQGASPRRAEGSGLGLAICQELVALMDGSIKVASEPGCGTRFTVSLPMQPCACAGHTCMPAPSSVGTPGGWRVLLVEDDPVVSEVIANLLRARGHVVAAVSDGLAAMSELSAGRYDVLLLDLDLPLVDGFQIARMVRRIEAMASLPIVAVTARSAGDEVSAIREAGMDALLRKPMSGDEMDVVLERVCRTPLAAAS
ncbi:ATP-binding protein [Dyella sp. 333MFSha]|uniref:hybrid sensor histidine kinase/response regulator n=1 Tax=Dyella sp. 333MFSha TaxID=1798240 RepID=UPI000882B9B8|nr:ATP-binding protein [Dyella sp. 333MFSha]SDF89880.1 Signal transduction histidine kinase [Dyella sp. 333MFSha]